MHASDFALFLDLYGDLPASDIPERWTNPDPRTATKDDVYLAVMLHAYAQWTGRSGFPAIQKFLIDAFGTERIRFTKNEAGEIIGLEPAKEYMPMG